MRRWWILLLLAFLAIPLFAQVPGYTRVLLPFYTRPVAGAFGSLWEVRTWMYYRGEEQISIAPAPRICAVLCPGDDGVAGRPPVGYAPIELDITVPPLESGILMHVPSGHVDEIELESRVQDVSQNALALGTEVPVVPEAQFRSDVVDLLRVPVEAGTRAMLRVYALPEVTPARVTIRYFRNDANLDRQMLREDELALTTPAAIGAWPVYPSFVMVAVPQFDGVSAVMIEVEQVTQGLRVWAMASATNNATQNVTIITPRAR